MCDCVTDLAEGKKSFYNSVFLFSVDTLYGCVFAPLKDEVNEASKLYAVLELRLKKKVKDRDAVKEQKGKRREQKKKKRTLSVRTGKQ